MSRVRRGPGGGRIALLLLATAAALLMAGLPAQVPSRVAAAAFAPADTLPGWLARIVREPLARAHWGVALYDLQADRWIARHGADRYFMPASNLKLVVSAIALERLGPEFRYRTSVYATGPIGPDGVLTGDLILYGRGDPNLSGRYAPTMTAIFESLADSLATIGLERVTGGLVADESHWDAQYLHGDWASYDVLWWYAAPVGALGFNDNSIDVHIRPAARAGLPPLIESEPVTGFYSLDNRAVTGPPGGDASFDLTREPGTNRITAYGVLPLEADRKTEYFAVVNPAAYAGTVFAEMLTRRGIVVEGGVRTVSDPSRSAVAAGDTVALAAHLSPPLTRIVESINGRSQNWHAEQLLKTLGRETAGEGSWEAGLAVERTALAALGVDTTAFLLRDASGLSGANLATPAGIVELLARMRERPHGELFAASLPVAGESGSLKRRFAGTTAAGRVRAKTGFIANVYAISGYMTTLSGRELAFSVIVNGAAIDATPAIDRLVEAFVSGHAP